MKDWASSSGKLLAATGIGIVPGSVLYVYLGVFGKAARHGASGLEWLLCGIGLLATLAAVILVARKAKALLDEATRPPNGKARP